jgi:hypothetical protein
MSETRHTPGPWQWFNYPDGRKLLTATNRAVIHCPDTPMSCEPADRDLIAAAPELLEALKTLTGAVDNLDGDPRALVATMGQAWAAIAKAEGR